MNSSTNGNDFYDVVIIGAGPAGLSAAVNAKARNLTALVMDSRRPVSKVRQYPEVTNYLGLPQVTGEQLATHFSEHFSRTGYPFRQEKALTVSPMGGRLMVTSGANVYEGKSVIVTVGVAQSKVLPGEEQFLGRGVSYCVTCDGALFRDKDVVVVGYIPEGEEEANALAGLARRVTYVATYANVETLTSTVTLTHATPQEVLGDGFARALKTDAGDISADGVFIIREAVPVTTLMDGLEVKDGFIQVDSQMATNVEGVYAAGDCTGPPFQIARAVGQGQVAALSAARYVFRGRAKN